MGGGDIFEWSLEICEKWYIPADVKDNKNKKRLKIWWLYITNFYKKYLQNLKYNVKSYVLSIWFWLVFYPFWYFLLRTGGGVFLLNEQNLLSMAKVICPQSLNHIAINNDVYNILFDSWPLLQIRLSSPVFQFYVYVDPMFYVKHWQGT